MRAEQQVQRTQGRAEQQVQRTQGRAQSITDNTVKETDMLLQIVASYTINNFVNKLIYFLFLWVVNFDSRYLFCEGVGGIEA